MIVARRFLIGGRVQGVGFRMFAQESAMIEGINGFVRNLPDGHVEVFAEGDQEAVDRVEPLLSECENRSRGARVDEFDVEPASPSHRATGFHIR
jgi:acylphosphatase